MLSTHTGPLALLALLASVATAQTPAATNKVTVSGTSNLHDWSCSTTAVTTALGLTPAVTPSKDVLPAQLKTLQVRIPVKSLTCDHDGMNDNTYKALKVDQAPEITWVLVHFDVAPGASADAFTVHATGTLTIAGTAKTVTMDVSGQRLPDGSVKATGTVPLLMRDYGISPPTALLGTLKTGNDVKITFELTIKPATTTPLPPR